MAKGDHLRVCHGLYYHHGIDMGDQTVIHFGTGSKKKTNPKIDRVSLEVFSGGKPIEIVDSEAEFSPDEICRRAEQRMNQTDYRLLENNCEHFASWCRVGEHRSLQVWRVRKLVESAGAASVRCLANGTSTISTAVSASLKTALPASLRGGLSKISPWLVLADVAELSSSQVSLQLGFDENKSERIGQAAGVATSATVGMLLAGPVGAAANIGLWKGSQHIAKRITGWIASPQTPSKKTL